MRQFIRIFCLIFLFCLLFSCANRSSYVEDTKKWMEENGKIKVLSTIAMINDLVKRIGGDHVDALTLITGELDPHSYQLVKGDDEKLAFADIIIANGLGLEHGPSLQQYLAQSSKVISLGDLIRQKNPHTILYYNGQLDPHIWMDIGLWAKSVPFIVNVLSVKDPKNAADYAYRGQQLMDELLRNNVEVREILHAIPPSHRYLVTSHDAFNYFARAYLATEEEKQTGDWQKRFEAPEGLAPESQLSTSDIQFIISHMHQYNIRVLFPESNVSRDSIKKIVQAGREKGMELLIATPPLYADAMGKAGSDGDSYVKMIKHDANSIAYYLKNGMQGP